MSSTIPNSAVTAQSPDSPLKVPPGRTPPTPFRGSSQPVRGTEGAWSLLLASATLRTFVSESFLSAMLETLKSAADSRAFASTDRMRFLQRLIRIPTPSRRAEQYVSRDPLCSRVPHSFNSSRSRTDLAVLERFCRTCAPPSLQLSFLRPQLRFYSEGKVILRLAGGNFLEAFRATISCTLSPISG
jgi:hypothetical protein